MSGLALRKNPALVPSCLTHIVQDGFGSSMSVLLIVLAETFGLSYTQVGLLKGLRSGAQATLEVFSGWIAERMGDAVLLMFGLSVLGIGFLALPFASNIGIIGLCFLVIGAGTALHHAPSSSLVVNNSAAEQQSGALGIYNASGDVGKLVFTGVFSLGIGLGVAWYEISFFFGVLAVVTAFSVWLMARHVPSEITRKRASGSTDQEGEKSKGWGILDWRSYRVLLFVSSIDTGVQTVGIIFAPFIMVAKGLPVSIATAGAVILLAGGVFGKACCGFLAAKIGPFKAFALVQVLTAIGLVLVAISPGWIALFLLFPLGCVLQGSSSITYGHASKLIQPEKMARGYALLYAPGSFASIISPIIFGWYADGNGIDNATFLMSLFVLLSIPPMAMLKASSGE